MDEKRGDGTMRRRGMIAGAAALMASIAARHMSETVTAAPVQYVKLGANASVIDTPTVVINNAAATSGPALFGYRDPGGAVAAPAAGDAGVAGSTTFTDADGVVGQSLNGTGAKGVHGVASSGYGVFGEATSGYGASFQGGVAPLRLVPGPLASAALAASGHTAGEFYVTSDNLLYFFDGAHWRQVTLAPVPSNSSEQNSSEPGNGPPQSSQPAKAQGSAPGQGVAVNATPSATGSPSAQPAPKPRP